MMRTVMSGPAWVAYAQIYVESAENYADLGDFCWAAERAVRGGGGGGVVPDHRAAHRQGRVYGRSTRQDAVGRVQRGGRRRGGVPADGCGGAAGLGRERYWPLELEQVGYRVRYSGWEMDAGHQAGPPMDDEPLVDRYLVESGRHGLRRTGR